MYSRKSNASGIKPDYVLLRKASNKQSAQEMQNFFLQNPTLFMSTHCVQDLAINKSKIVVEVIFIKKVLFLFPIKWFCLSWERDLQEAKEPYHQAPNVYFWFLKLAKIVIHFKNIFFCFHYQLVKVWFFQKQYVKSQLFFFMCWKLISNFWMFFTL